MLYTKTRDFTKRIIYTLWKRIQPSQVMYTGRIKNIFIGSIIYVMKQRYRKLLFLGTTK